MKIDRIVSAACYLSVFTIFVFDCMTPQDVNLPTLYIAYVLLSLWHSQVYFSRGVASLATFLTLLPLVLFPTHQTHWESLLFNRGTTVVLVWMASQILVERKRLALEREKAVEERDEAQHEVENLVKLLPMCAWCKKIRDDEGYWEGIESFLTKHTTAITHGICPDCSGNLSHEIDGLNCKPTTLNQGSVHKGASQQRG